MKKKLKYAALAFAMTTSLAFAAAADETSKRSDSPGFCQRDSEAGFPNQGSEYCAPTSLSDAFIFLTQKRGLTGLVKETDHSGQIQLIKELAQDMGTDPGAGTGPDQILTGVQKYVSASGFRLKNLEIETWRPLGKSNSKFRVGQKPEWSWLQTHANDPDSVVLLNVGWYMKKTKGWVRNGGHWVDVVGADAAATRLFIHNPLLTPQQQKNQQAVDLKPVPADELVFRTAKDSARSMTGYYSAGGPALSYGAKVLPIVDGVIVFQVIR